MSGSQISPLTLAMLQASGSGNQPMDPAMAGALPRLQLAQSLMQSGMSDAPTTRLGILSRLGQALAGGFLSNSANSGLQDILKQRALDTANTMNEMRGGSTPTTSATPTPTSQATPPASGFTGQLASAEGGTNPGAVNSSGYSGQYQFGASRLADPAIGVYTPAAGEDLKANQWKGTFNIPGFPDVKTHADFLANPDAQKAVFDTHIADIDKAISLTPGAESMDQNGLRAVAHLGGTQGMQKFIESGGKYDPADANGTHLSDYYARFSKPVQVAGPGAPTGTAPTGTAPTGTPGTPPSPGTLPSQATAANALDMIRRANDAIARTAMDPYNPTNAAIAKAAAAQIEYAHTLLSTAQGHVTPGPNGIYYKGTGEPIFPPAGRFATDAHGNLIQSQPGGDVRVVAPNPTGIAGTGTENEVMRTLAELGPKVVNGTASPQEIATYNTAATTYQGFKTVTNPADQSLTRVPEHPLPPGMPTPGGSIAPPPGTAPPLTPLTPGGRGPAAQQAIVEDQAKNDAKAVSEEQATVMKSHDLLGTTQTIRSMAPQVTTGTGADQRLRVGQLFSALGVPPETVKSWTGTDTPSGELLQKKLFELSTGATRAMGAREPGSVMMMFQKNYPNLDSRNMTIDAMTRLLDMDQVYKENEIGGRQQYLSQQVSGLGQGKEYGGMAGYHQPDPRVYQAAALASGGMPFSVWTQGLSPKDQQAALTLAEKVYPDATALNRDGVKVPLVRPQAPPNGR